MQTRPFAVFIRGPGAKEARRNLRIIAQSRLRDMRRVLRAANEAQGLKTPRTKLSLPTSTLIADLLADEVQRIKGSS